ncbi:MAG: DUF4476 domain-containing protein [Bacteroidia bacterium]|nr:DUF4476 domain-containing protein [Bacteroidia bacterium]MDW8346616.1 DUF4476 domain-containing protein [Bacteroidia bacterium]
MVNTPGLCSIVISTPNNEPITVLINNAIQNPTPQPIVTLDGIPAGTHNVKINRHVGIMSYTVVDKTLLLYPNTRVSYLLQINSLYQYDLVPTGTQPWSPTPVFTPPIEGYNGPYGCPTPTLNPQDFEALKQTIKNQPFGSTKMSIAKQAVSNHCLLSQQVVELVSLFSFENEKLEIAKFCYRQTCDQGRYFVVHNALTFTSSKEELSRYIQETGSGQFNPNQMQNWNGNWGSNWNNNSTSPPIPGYNGPYGCPAPTLNNTAFTQAKQTIASNNFDDTRLTIAKQIIRNNCMLASQVAEIMRLFTFENSKLEIAKFAYSYTCDKGRYYVVNSELRNSSSIQELANYIQGR